MGGSGQGDSMSLPWLLSRCWTRQGPWRLSMERSTAAGDDAGTVAGISALAARLATLRDARRARGKRYPLPLVLVLVVLGLSWRRMPHHNTIRRVLAEAVDPTELDAVVGAFFREQAGVGESMVISIDGKSVRGTITGATPRGEHLLAAYLPAEGIVLRQVAAGEKENEITVAPQLL